MRYLSQRYTMPYRECMAVLTDIGREAPEMKPFKVSQSPAAFFAAAKLHLYGSIFK